MLNKLKVYLILSVTGLLCCSCSANKNNNYQTIKQKKETGGNYSSKSYTSPQKNNTKNNNTDEINRDVLKFLGHRCLDIIKNPENVETYQIDWANKSKNISTGIHGYPVLQKGRNLNNEEIKAVNKIISSSSSYDFKWSKRIRIRPSYVLRFIRHSDQADIAIDINTRQWAFYHENKIMAEDISKSANADLQNIIANLF